MFDLLFSDRPRRPYCGIIRENTCLFWHKYKLVKVDKGIKYFECKSCNKRKIEIHESSTYGKVDLDWLNDMENFNG